MHPTLPSCWILLLIVATSSAQDEFQRPNNDFNTDSTSTGSQRNGNHPPSNFQIGPVDVQTGPNWAVNVLDFIKIKRKPNGGVDVNVQLPDNVFNRANSPQGNDFGDTTVQHFKRRRRSSALPTLKSLDQELQEDGGYQKLVQVSNSVASADEDKESTIKIGNITVKTGKNWSVDFGKLKIKRKPEGGIDISMDPPDNQKMPMPPNGGDPYSDPSVEVPRKRRELNNWTSKVVQQSEGTVQPRRQIK